MTTHAQHRPIRSMPQNAEALAQMNALRRLIDLHSAMYSQQQDLMQLALKHKGEKQFFESAALFERKQWALQLGGSARRTVQTHLDRTEALGQMRRIATAPSPDVFDKLNVDFPHFAEATDFLKRSMALCRLGDERLLSLRPMLYSGDAGVGKTAYATELSKLLGVPCTRIDIGTLSAAFGLTGLDVGYDSGKPGIVWDALQSECMSPLIFLDELDKCGSDTRHSHLQPLLTLLEKVTSISFADNAIGLPIDASYVIWQATCNNVDLIESALLSRFKVINIPTPNPLQMRAITKSIHRSIMSTSDWAAAFDPDLPDDVIDLLCYSTPREVGRTLEDAFANAAMAGKRKLNADMVRINRDSQKRGIGFIN